MHISKYLLEKLLIQNLKYVHSWKKRLHSQHILSNTFWIDILPFHWWHGGIGHGFSFLVTQKWELNANSHKFLWNFLNITNKIQNTYLRDKDQGLDRDLMKEFLKLAWKLLQIMNICSWFCPIFILCLKIFEIFVAFKRGRSLLPNHFHVLLHNPISNDKKKLLVEVLTFNPAMCCQNKIFKLTYSLENKNFTMPVSCSSAFLSFPRFHGEKHEDSASTVEHGKICKIFISYQNVIEKMKNELSRLRWRRSRARWPHQSSSQVIIGLKILAVPQNKEKIKSRELLHQLQTLSTVARVSRRFFMSLMYLCFIHSMKNHKKGI